MQFDLTKEFVDELKDAIADGRDNFIHEQVGDLHPADIAEILDRVNLQQALYLYAGLEPELGAEAMLELDEDVREKLLSNLSSKQIADDIIDNIDSDDAADVIGELPENKQEEVINAIGDLDHARDIKNLLRYHEDTAGGLMGTEMVRVNTNWTVGQAIREMRRQSEDVDQVYTVYVVDNDQKLLGRLSLKALLFAAQSMQTLVQEIFRTDVRFATTDMTQEEVAQSFQKYDLVVLPVVDAENRLVGRITVDDVVDVMKEEADKDYQMASGIAEDVESSDTVWILSRARLPWLLVGMIGGILGAKVIGLYDVELAQHTIMAFFIPLIAAMGGNVGVQSSAIVVQGLANNSMTADGIGSKLGKEFLVGLLNGIVCSLIIFAYIFFFENDLTLGITVALSLFSVIIFAAIFGTFIPLTLNRFKIDPALATGPFITTVNDVLGLWIYFLIGKVMIFG
jgi:magnesium transporter